MKLKQKKSRCVKLHIPWVPFSVNHLYHIVVKRKKGAKYPFGDPRNYYGTKVLKQEARQYKAEIKHGFRKIVMFDCPVSFVVVVHPPDKRKRDLDNLSKLLQDSLTGVVWTDDSLVQEMYFIRKEVIKGGGLKCLIQPYVEGESMIDQLVAMQP